MRQGPGTERPRRLAARSMRPAAFLSAILLSLTDCGREKKSTTYGRRKASVTAHYDDGVRLYPRCAAVGHGPWRGAGARVSIGIAVFAGMLLASTVGLFFIPMLYVAIQSGAYLVAGKRQAIRGLPGPMPELEGGITDALEAADDVPGRRFDRMQKVQTRWEYVSERPGQTDL